MVHATTWMSLMDEFHTEWKKPEKRVNIIWFHLYKALETTKLIYNGGNQWLSRTRVKGGMTGKGHKGTLQKDLKVLCLDNGGDYTGWWLQWLFTLVETTKLCIKMNVSTVCKFYFFIKKLKLLRLSFRQLEAWIHQETNELQKQQIGQKRCFLKHP